MTVVGGQRNSSQGPTIPGLSVLALQMYSRNNDLTGYSFVFSLQIFHLVNTAGLTTKI